MYKSFVSLGRYIPKYFILFVAVVNDIISLSKIDTPLGTPRKRENNQIKSEIKEKTLLQMPQK